MRQIILLLFLASIVNSVPCSPADYDKNSLSSATPNNDSATNSATGQASADSVKAKTPKLYGRIEQIVQGPGAQFPIVLKAQTAKMDTSRLTKSLQHGEANFSGVVVKSFPQQYAGAWGGNLKIWTSQIDPICWQIDADEANSIRQLMVSGRDGTVNFDFAQDSAGKIDLEPAKVVFMVPMKGTEAEKQMNNMLGGGQLGQAAGATLPGMDSQQVAGMMRQMMSTMNVPVIVSFGATETTPYMIGVSGNSFRSAVLKNSIRQLAPGVLEQQIVTQDVQRNNKTGTVRQEYAETVIRFTSQGANSLYVLAASVNYTAERKFERKLVLYGTVHKGQVMPDMTANPLGLLNNMMPGGSQMPQLPAGQNPFQNFFPR